MELTTPMLPSSILFSSRTITFGTRLYLGRTEALPGIRSRIHDGLEILGGQVKCRSFGEPIDYDWRHGKSAESFPKIHGQ